ncbi:Fe-S biogenesis protein NfuA [Kangiella profundi]|uniref:Fe/S biogenesis protein NfuA n=1 Tax=Kangiella profundi TaxID=1561924 RepID=A0A2K9AWR3_9GAMM|nr:Fe-S biogenesis protein NfuA [Kangiella profundi]AUD79561.1 Fe-S biogenesis protein NfuA [Kangiella profundi]MBD3668894.1 Fe-S biogenesis protein NfuA [Kangiella sp.]GGE97390.1 Fe/S biogenesis protein NfuA [Kangiella profundi]
MITISEAAQEHFRRLLAGQEEPDTGIRVFVVNPGTSHAECGVSYCPPDAIEDTDTELKFDGFSAFIDEDSAPYLEEAEIDYQKEQTGGQLTLRAPNAKARKVDDDAPASDRIRYYLESEINPELANHGGQVSLVEFTQSGIAVLQFGGGCQGCGMVDVTLKEGIEKTLIERVPEVKGVKDVTEHAEGENPYY